MGVCGSKSKVEDAVENQLKQDSLKNALNMKILMLGSGESGKTTVLKQIKTTYKIAMTPHELQDVKYSLRRNAYQCIVVLIEQAEKFEYDLGAEDKKRAAALLAYECDDEDVLSIGLADSILHLWKGNEAIKNVWDRRSEYWILDSTEYYFTHLERFMQDDFEPTEEDCVMARVMTSGIISTEISIPPISATIVDVGGQRTERRKWLHCFDNVNGIIYVVNLAGYNTVLFEDQSQNRMEECYNLFKETVTNPTFANTPIYVFFNKKDLFETKIRKESITACKLFAGYTGPEDLQSCINYVQEKFQGAVQTGSDRIKVYPVAARFKKDVAAAFSEVLDDLKFRNKKNIIRATAGLKK